MSGCIVSSSIAVQNGAYKTCACAGESYHITCCYSGPVLPIWSWQWRCSVGQCSEASTFCLAAAPIWAATAAQLQPSLFTMYAVSSVMNWVILDMYLLWSDTLILNTLYVRYDGSLWFLDQSFKITPLSVEVSNFVNIRTTMWAGYSNDSVLLNRAQCDITAQFVSQCGNNFNPTHLLKLTTLKGAGPNNH